MNFIYQLLFVIITAGFFVTANVLSGQWAKTGNNLLWIPIVVLAAIGYFLFGLLIKQTNLAIGAGLIDSLLLIISISVGIFIFKDVVNAKQVIGLILASLAVMLLI